MTTRRALTALVLGFLLLPLACATITPSEPRYLDSTPVSLWNVPPGARALVVATPVPDSATLGRPFGSALFLPAGPSWLYPAGPYRLTLNAAAAGAPSYAPLPDARVSTTP